jgi:hypothetical protein
MMKQDKKTAFWRLKFSLTREIVSQEIINNLGKRSQNGSPSLIYEIWKFLAFAFPDLRTVCRVAWKFPKFIFRTEVLLK